MDFADTNTSPPAGARLKGDDGPPRVLVAMETCSLRDELVRLLTADGHDVACEMRVEPARVAVLRDAYDLIILSPRLADGSGFEVADLVNRLRPATKIVVAAAAATFEGAVEAMRHGAIDFLSMPMGAAALRSRLAAALGRSRFDREREQRLLRLRSICRTLNTARHEISRQVDLLCADLAHAYEEIAGQLSDVAMVTEFRTLLRQELDVEDLLRTALEYLLTRTGPTNVAVFLPGECDDFNLGAYVNYNCPRETADILLEQLGTRVCRQMEDETEIVRFDDARSFAAFVGGDAAIAAGSQVIAFSARHDGECMAIVVLFRGADEPFSKELASVIDLLRPIFAEQIATVIRLHHRAQPDWPHEASGEAPGEESDGEWGLAA